MVEQAALRHEITVILAVKTVIQKIYNSVILDSAGGSNNGVSSVSALQYRPSGYVLFALVLIYSTVLFLDEKLEHLLSGKQSVRIMASSLQFLVYSIGPADKSILLWF